MRVHVLGIPHTVSSSEFLTCAFTQKVRKLCAMLHRRGHDVIHYGIEGSEVEATENVVLLSRKEFDGAYPHPGTAFYNHEDTSGPRRDYLVKWTHALSEALRRRVRMPHAEIVAVTWGGPQWIALGGVETPHFAVESGIGYPIVKANYRVYESYAWLHMHLGRDNLFGGEKWYWAVIPNAFELSEFSFGEKRGDEFLFLGRFNYDKGIKEAVSAVGKIGGRIRIVGQGDPAAWLAMGNHVTYEPPAGIQRRRELLSTCRAVLAPSFYVEPFCGVAVEAMLSGAPVVTTDWGAFAETVLHGTTGYRIRSYEQLVWAVRNVHRISPHACRAWASNNYSTERVALQYEEFFQQVLNIRTDTDPKTEGFYTPHPTRPSLHWLCRHYPEASRERIDTEEPHVPPAPRSEWQEAQDWERSWWGLDWNARWDEEIQKQATYARLMGLPPDLSLGGAHVLDVGCGPVSMLLRARHRGDGCRGVDPLAVSEATRERYRKADVEFLNVKAEAMPEDRFDEAWGYNVLQHTEDPKAILAKMGRMAPSVRMFEWLVPDKYPGHPQCLTESLFAEAFPEGTWKRAIWTVGTLSEHGASTGFLALHVTRR